MIVNNNCQAFYKKNLARFLIIVFMLAIIPFALPSRVEAAATTIPSDDYVIQSDDTYQLADGYSGTISIGDAVSNVTIIGSGDGLACSARIDIPATLNNDLTLTIQDLKLNSPGRGIDIDTSNQVNLYISGTCEITAAGTGIYVPVGKTIVIDHTTSDAADELTVSVNSGIYCAGIGGGGGNITINGGTINASGGNLGAGIGGDGAVSDGQGSMTGPGGGMITINGGIVNAAGGGGGAGIGGGSAGGGTHPDETMTGGSGGRITITGGTINAIGGNCGAGIGGGAGEAAAIVNNAYGGDGGTITISGGTITASGDNGGAGIGGGYANTTGSTTLTGGSGADVTITNNPTIIATGSGGGEHIGYGCSGPDSGSLKDGVGSDMSHLRFQVVDGAGSGIAGAAVTVDSHDYITNNEGVTGCTVPKNAAASYSAAAAGYATKSDTTTPSIMNNDISISLVSNIATVTSSAYTVSDGGTANETITGVPGNTAKAAFEANLSRGERHQTWDDNAIHDPVASGDTLAVTAQDGITQVTYTIALETFNVTYDGNTNTGGSAPTDTNNYAENNTVTILGNTGSLVKSGYTFAGWNTQADGSGTSNGAGDTFPMPASNVILYARWEEQSSHVGGGGGPSSAPVNSTTGQANVYPSQGGKISLGSDVALNISANALNGSSCLSVKIEKADSPPSLPFGFMLLGQVYSFSVDGQDHYQFKKPVTITFTIDPDKVTKGEVPGVYYYDTSTFRWVSLPGTVSGNTITVTVDHFTEFVVLVKAEAAQPAEIKTSFTDISSHWAQEAIKKMAALGAVSGYPDGTFKPDANITRAEFVTILVKALRLVSTAADKTFSDTANHWAGHNIAIAAALGIVGGYTDDTFKPDDPITREEMAVMAVKAANLAEASGETTFTDNDRISFWAKSSVWAAVSAGIMNGCPDNTFKPRNNAARAEAVSVILNAMK